MVEFKAKPLPFILLVVLLLAGAYRLWHAHVPILGESKNVNASQYGGRGEDAELKLTSIENQASGSYLLDFFHIAGMDGLKITWSHGTNTKDALTSVLKDDTVLMVEADVRVKGNRSVMAHDVRDAMTNEFTLQEWLTNFKSITNKGIKLDIKSLDALRPSLISLKEMKSHLHIPILINSDILVGPNGQDPDVPANEFFEAVQNIVPDVTLSIGWTSEFKKLGNNFNYTKNMVDEMLKVCHGKTQPITFPIRASLIGHSHNELKRLVTSIPRSTLTIWHYYADEVDLDNLLAIRKDFHKDQVFYDIPSDMKDLIKKTSVR